MTTIIVTGGAGFIGSNYIFYMLNKHPDYRIICIDSLTYAGNIDTLKSVIDYENFKFYCADICDEKIITQIIKKEKPDAIVNFAAESHVDRSINNPIIFLETNIIGTSVLMNACLKNNVKRFHQVSTDEVYGDLPLNRPDLKFNEKTPLHTSSPYSSSKAGADLLVMSYVKTYGLNATITRCSNNYGPFQFPEKLIPLMITKIQKNEKLPVYGTGLNVRDWLYVDDHCSAIDMVLQKGKCGEIYNVGGNNERSNIEIIQIILEELGASTNLIEYVEDRKGHDLRYAIDSTKIRKEIGWIPKTNFDNGIKATIEWYKENTIWTDNIFSGKYVKLNEHWRNEKY